MTIKELAGIDRLKYEIARAASISKEGHVASAYSILDILWVLYKHVMNLSSSPDAVEDKFILSKGHASLALYAIFLEMNYIDLNEFLTFGQYSSRLGGHPDSNKMKEIVASTGSLGHGLPIAVGHAMASKINQDPNQIFCLVGDGECNEGTVWEAALLAAHHQLDNLCCIVDFNHSTDRALDLGDLAAKFSSFGWDAIIVDGHSHVELKKAISRKSINKPSAIIAETIKGYGVKMMEGDPSWHHRSPSEEDLSNIFKELINHA